MVTTGAGSHVAGSSRRLPAAIGGYRVVERVGKGAMGVVYSAHDEAGRPVAIKVMMADLEGDSETRERFYREARVAGRLQHRNLISVFDMGEDHGRLFMVMELLRGRTLSEYLRGTRPGLETCLDMMGQICEGLAVAHVHGIFHRDVKPGNIFVQNDGSVKVLDFGVARLADSNMTASGYIVGTPDFMSPEQARGREIDHRSDIFSTGAVFYYMLSGRKPFSAADLPAVLHKVEAEDPPPLREDEAPTGLWRIIARALAKPLTRRYQELGELLADVTRFQRAYDRESRELALAVRQRVVELQATIEQRRRAGGLPTGDSALADDLFGVELRERYPVLDDRGADALGTMPFRRRAITEIREHVEQRFARLASAAASSGTEVRA
jgi:serine/threonine protein kinase